MLLPFIKKGVLVEIDGQHPTNIDEADRLLQGTVGTKVHIGIKPRGSDAIQYVDVIREDYRLLGIYHPDLTINFSPTGIDPDVRTVSGFNNLTFYLLTLLVNSYGLQIPGKPVAVEGYPGLVSYIVNDRDDLTQESSQREASRLIPSALNEITQAYQKKVFSDKIVNSQNGESRFESDSGNPIHKHPTV